MSDTIEMSYYPPKGSRYSWNPWELKGRPWWYRYPHRDCTLRVWLSAHGYWGIAELKELDGTWKELRTPFYPEPLNALIVTEILGDELIKFENRPQWADEALKLGWRPPVKQA